MYSTSKNKQCLFKFEYSTYIVLFYIQDSFTQGFNCICASHHTSETIFCTDIKYKYCISITFLYNLFAMNN